MRKTLLLLLSLCLPAAPAFSKDARVSAHYPEGPLIAGDRVLFAEMHEDRIVSWQAGEGHTSIFYKRRGCGPTAIAPYGDGYAVLCHLPNEVHLVSRAGRLRTRLKKDVRRRTFLNPNDASADGHGGVYFSASGPFAREGQPTGALMYLSAQGEIRRLADKLDYANGVHFDRRTRLLYVSEHLGGRVLTYPEIAPGRLGRPAVFWNLAREGIEPVKGYPLMGPDGLETDGQGNLYAAVYGAGTLFILSPRGRVLHRIESLESLLTNVALSADERHLIVTGSRISRARPFSGSIRRIVNPLAAQ